MTIDLHSILTFLLGIVVSMLAWGFNELWKAMARLRTDLTSLEVKMSTDYVRYDRMQDVVEPIMAALNDIRSRLDHKADKP